MAFECMQLEVSRLIVQAGAQWQPCSFARRVVERTSAVVSATPSPIRAFADGPLSRSSSLSNHTSPLRFHISGRCSAVCSGWPIVCSVRSARTWAPTTGAPCGACVPRMAAHRRARERPRFGHRVCERVRGMTPSCICSAVCRAAMRVSVVSVINGLRRAGINCRFGHVLDQPTPLGLMPRHRSWQCRRVELHTWVWARENRYCCECEPPLGLLHAVLGKTVIHVPATTLRSRGRIAHGVRRPTLRASGQKRESQAGVRQWPPHGGDGRARFPPRSPELERMGG